MSIIGLIVTSTWYHTKIRSKIYFSPIYGFPGVNVVEDKTSPIYDPFESSLSTLVKVSGDKKTLEDSGAYRNIIGLLSSRGSIKRLSKVSKFVKLKTDLVPKKRGKGKGPNLIRDRALPSLK
jgi:hypothetical protein